MIKRSEGYSIRQVIELTGTSEFLLRAWELRYNALVPKRTKTGRRLYSSEDILRARALLELTQRGSRVGSIAKLPLNSLYDLLDTTTVEKIIESPQIVVIKDLVKKANHYKWNQVYQIFIKELKKCTPSQWIHSFLLPLITEMNRQVDLGNFSIAQEHILTAYIKECLNQLKIKKSKANSPRIVFATPEGDHHDIGLMIACRMAEISGSNTLYLGPNMPLRELAETCLRFHATHLVLTSTVTVKDGAKNDLHQCVNFLDRHLAPTVKLWIAGKNTHNQRLSLKRDFKVLSSFMNFKQELQND